MDFTVPTNNRVKIKENETIDKYLDIAREQEKLRNLKVTVIISEVEASKVICWLVGWLAFMAYQPL